MISGQTAITAARIVGCGADRIHSTETKTAPESPRDWQLLHSEVGVESRSRQLSIPHLEVGEKNATQSNPDSCEGSDWESSSSLSSSSRP